MTNDGRELFEYWLKMPTWCAEDAIELLVFRSDPRNKSPETSYMSSLVSSGLADHFKLFGLIDNYRVELDGLHVDGPKRSPSEWIRCYRDYPNAEPLPSVNTVRADEINLLSNPSRAHVSENLVILNQASARFWANADRDDRDTHPDKSDVVAWLMERGFSQVTAENGATIIRPEWARTGRKPKE